MPYPDAGCQLRGVADKPGIHVLIGGPGLARGRSAEAADAPGRAVADDPFHEAGHLVGNPGVKGVAEGGVLFFQHLAGAVHNLFDEKSLGHPAAVGKSRICPGQLKGGDAGGSQGQGEVFDQGGGETQSLGQVNGVGCPYLLQDLDGGDIPGVHQGISKRGWAFKLIVVVLGCPILHGGGAAEMNRLVKDHGGRGHSLFKGGGINKGLESRAGLTAGLGRPVELALLEIRAAHHCPDISGFHLHGDQGGLGQGVGVLALTDGPFGGAALYGHVGGLLQVLVKGGVDAESAGQEGFAAILAFDVGLDMFNEIIVFNRPFLGRIPEQGLFIGFLRRSGGDVAFFCHAIQNVELPVFGQLEIAERGIAARRLRQSGKESDLCKVQILNPLVEIDLGRGLDPIGAAAEIYLVEIDVEDLFLAQGGVDAVGENCFLDFAGVGFFRGQQECPGDLLGYGAAPLAPFSGTKIVEKRPDDRPGVNPAVLIKPGVFRGHKGLGEQLRHGGERDKGSVFP